MSPHKAGGHTPLITELRDFERPHGSWVTPSVVSEGLAGERDRESATNRSGVLELGLGKSQMEFQNLVKKIVFYHSLAHDFDTVSGCNLTIF